MKGVIFFGVFWFMIIGGLLWWKLTAYEQSIIDLAATEARASYNKDLLFRRWAASHGGVYVPVTEKTPSNPYLTNIEEQNITTPSNRALTLLNPAYITRQIFEIAQQQYGVRGHITSLQPIRPGNKPDEWERQALIAFTEGATEIQTVSNIGGSKYLRLMRPMLIEQNCLKCHAYQGYKVGDLRGGISVSVPLAPYLNITRDNYLVDIIIHAAIFILGLAGFGLAFTNLTKTEGKKITAQKALQDSEHHLETIFKAADNVAFVTTDLGGKHAKVMDFSPGAENIFGYRASEVIGKEVSLLHPPGSSEKFSEMQESLQKGNKGYSGEITLIRKSKEEFSALFTIHPLHNSSGELIGTVGVSVDISKRKRMEQALKQSNEEAQALLNATTESAFLIEPDGTFITMNDVTAIRLGRKTTDLIGKKAYDFLPPDVAQSRRKRLEQVIESGKPLRFTDEIAGTYLDHSIYPLSDASGKVTHIAVFAQDITSQRLSEKVLIENEIKFRSVFEEAPLNYQALDEQGTIVEVNSNWLETMGYSRGEVIGKNFEIFLVDSYKTYFRENYATLISGSRHHDFELEIIKKDDSTLLFSIHGTLALKNGKETSRAHCVLTDITGQRSAETALKRDLELNQAIADISKLLLAETYNLKTVSKATLDAARAITGSEHGFVSCIDKKTLENVSYTLTDMLGESCHLNDQTLSFPLETDGSYRGLWGHALNSGEPFLTNNPATHPRSKGLPEGHVPLHRYMAVPVLIGKNLLGMIALANADQDYTEEDIAAVHRIAEVFALAVHREDYETKRTELEQNLRQLQKNEAIGALASGIAHDFNNILTPIMGYSEMLMDDIPDNSTLQDNVYQILSAAGRAKDLTKQILTFSRQHEQEIIPLKPHLIIKEVVKLIRATIPSSIEIKQDIDTNSRAIMADPTQIHQLMMNLLTNAYQSITREKGLLSVSLENIDLQEEEHRPNLKAGPYISITVEDDGIGISKAILDKIFDPYFTTRPPGKGTGLGLSVVQGIVKKYNGDMKVESNPGEGSRFQILLPALEQHKSSRQSQKTQENMTGTETILLVDDELPIVTLGQRLLERFGYTVEIFTDSEKALKEITSSLARYDLVITDMTMPNVTGEVLTQEIRKLDTKLPIIICTGFSEIMTPEKAKAIKANGLLMKPVAGADMARMVRTVLDETKGSA